MPQVKKVLLDILKGMGYTVSRYRKHAPSPFDRLYPKLQQRLEGVKQPCIFDVGSHRGESIDRFGKIFPGSTIHAFEPDLNNFAILQERFGTDTSIFLNNFGIGETNDNLPFHKYAKSDVGGFNKIDLEDTWTKIRSQQLSISTMDFVTSSDKLPIRRIDDYMDERNIDHVYLLKIDTQGFEDKVLKGCSNALQRQRIDYIELELIIKGPYERTLSFKDIESALDSYGYRLYGIAEGGNYYKTPILQFDLLFASSECYFEGDYR